MSDSNTNPTAEPYMYDLIFMPDLIFIQLFSFQSISHVVMVKRVVIKRALRNNSWDAVTVRYSSDRECRISVINQSQRYSRKLKNE